MRSRLRTTTASQSSPVIVSRMPVAAMETWVAAAKASSAEARRPFQRVGWKQRLVHRSIRSAATTTSAGLIAVRHR